MGLIRTGIWSTPVALITLGSLLAACGGPGTASVEPYGSLEISTRVVVGGVALHDDPQPSIVTILRKGQQVRSVRVSAGRKRTVPLPPGTYEVAARISGWPTANCSAATATVAVDHLASARPRCLLAPGIG